MGKAVAPLAQYQHLMGSVLAAGRAIGPGVLTGLKAVSSEFERQKTLAAFWGVSGFQMGVMSLKSAFSSFLSTGGQGFSNWLQNTSAMLTQYRTALAGTAAVMIGMAAAAGLSSKHSQNMIGSIMSSKLIERKYGEEGTDKNKEVRKWIESAQDDDMVLGGRESRTKTLQTVLSKNGKYISGDKAKKVTEDIEKYFFANQEELKDKGIATAADLASRISAPVLSGEDAAFFEDKFGFGFTNKTAQARLGKLSTEAQGINIEEEKAKRPDVILTERVTKTTQKMGDAVIPALNTVLGAFLKLSDIIGKIPGLGKAMGWGAVLAGVASAGLIVVSMLGSLIPGLLSAYKAFQVVAAGVKVLGLSMAANPLGLAIIGIAALAAGLYYLEQRFGIVTKAWKMFSESSFGKGVLGYIDNAKKAIGDLLSGKGASGAIKLGLDMLGAASPMVKILMVIADFIKRFWVNSNILNKMFSTGLAVWQRVLDFFSWLLNSIKAGVQWVKDGLGITKAEKEKERDEAAARMDLKWHKGASDADPGYWVTKTGGDADPKKIASMKRYEDAVADAPNSVFSKIGEVLSGAMSNIIAPLTKVLTPLKTAIDGLVKWLGGGDSAPEAKVEIDPKTGKQAVYGPFQQPSPTDLSKFNIDPSKIKPTTALAAIKSNSPFMADGGQIKATGSIIGHGGEEVNPAEVVAGGETTLERITDMFSGGFGATGQTITISAPITVHVAKMDGKADVKALAASLDEEFDRKLLFRLRNELNTMGLRDIGYMRG